MSVRIIQGDVRDVLPTLAADSFDCIVTSPPYYGLRDYGTATWEGGDPGCDHRGRSQPIWSKEKDTGASRDKPGGNCAKCGAKRIDAQIGLEPTRDAYLETMVAVCRELRRVLKPSGVFFLNIGDSYAGSWGAQSRGGSTSDSSPFQGNSHIVDDQKIKNLSSIQIAAAARRGTHTGTIRDAGLKPKDLMLVPERLGIALQEDGWFVRSRIVWAKKNPMPESVTDRPTGAHETIWMLTKNPRYFWDAEAVAECHGKTYTSVDGVRSDKSLVPGSWPQSKRCGNKNQTRNLRNVWTDLWSIPSHPFPGAHFATFPPALVERCIKAGSSEKGSCPACGAPWDRVVETERVKHAHPPGPGGRANVPGRETSQSSCFRTGLVPINTTVGWRPSCKCRISGLIDCMPYTPVSARILDPFAGSGTVGLVADRLGRDATLIDLNTSYIDMSVNRIRDDAPLFAEVAAE